VLVLSATVARVDNKQKPISRVVQSVQSSLYSSTTIEVHAEARITLTSRLTCRTKQDTAVLTMSLGQGIAMYVCER
jgi:hypothetical protein